MRFTGVVAAACVITAGTWAYQRFGEARDARRFPPPGDLLEVDGRRVHVLRAGSGPPAVVVLPALGTPAVEWCRVLEALPDSVAAYVVDRPGIGWSEAGPWSGTPVALARWTSRLLDVLQVSSVVLVGHSMGGVIARICAANEPGRVAGLVLVDSSHEDQMRELGRLDRGARASGLVWAAARWLRCPAGWRRVAQDLRGRRPLLRELAGLVPDELAAGTAARSLTSAYRRADMLELLGFAVGMRAVPGRARRLGNLPVTVVTAGPVGRERWIPVWDRLQRSFLAMTSNGSQVNLADSGHHVNRDKPVVVAAAITDMVDLVRTSGTRSS